MSSSSDGLPEWSAEERSLWDSARNDRPPAASMRATLRAVGVSGAIVTAAGVAQGGAAAATSVAKSGGALGLLKWSGIAMLGGATALSGGALYRHSQSARPTAVQARSENPSRETARLTQAAQKPLASAPEKVEVTSEPHATSAALPAPPLPAPVRASSAPASQPDIGQEIRSIDAARTALRRGDTDEALRAIEHYRAEYGKKGSLGMEATVLRIEALLRGGNRAEGVRLANSFLASHPKSPYAPRIRALLR